MDRPEKHKSHNNATPLLGGVGIFLAFSVTLLCFFPLTPRLLLLIGAGLLLLLVGLLDDLYNLKPLHKLCCQAGIASAVVLFNADLVTANFAKYGIPEFILVGLCTLWIVLMINAFNLIDGLDGLATGTALIIFAAMAVISYLQGNVWMLGLHLVGVAACLGFLPYNFNPAKIFMGDAGSMLLGFTLALTHLYTLAEPFSISFLLGSAFIFIYPFMDVSFAFYRRLRHGVSLFKADRGHIHHVLMQMGFSVRKTVLAIYLCNLLFGGMAVLVFCLSLSPATVIVLGAATLISVCFLFRFLYLQLGRSGRNVRGGMMPKV